MSKEEVDFDSIERQVASATIDSVIEPLRIAIVGCRDYDDYKYFGEMVDQYLQQVKDLYPNRPIELYSGGAPGIDDMAEDYAQDHNYPFKRIDADWEKDPKIAGFIRNQKLAESVEWVLSFWDGLSTGTADMRNRAMSLRRRLRTIRIVKTSKRYHCRRKLQEWSRKKRGE